MLPSNRTSVVWNGFKSELMSTNLDKAAAITAHNTERIANRKPSSLSLFDVICWVFIVFWKATPTKEMLTMKTPAHTLKGSISFKKIAPKTVAIMGERASTVRVRRVPIFFKDII